MIIKLILDFISIFILGLFILACIGCAIKEEMNAMAYYIIMVFLLVPLITIIANMF